jgi:hypothetical protein
MAQTTPGVGAGKGGDRKLKNRKCYCCATGSGFGLSASELR